MVSDVHFTILTRIYDTIKMLILLHLLSVSKLLIFDTHRQPQKRAKRGPFPLEFVPESNPSGKDL